MNFSFSSAWNNAIDAGREERPLVVREHVYASELGKSHSDIWLKMRATPPTNPPNDRSKRKMEAGNIFEHLASLVLKRVGLLSDAQVRCEHQYPGLLKVTGKLDFLMGGKPSKMESLTDLDVPPAFARAGTAIGVKLMEQFPEGLPKSVVEIKSCASTTFERFLTTGKASRNHRLQLFHYLKSTGIEQGSVVYLSRDDLRILEIQVWLHDSDVEVEYRREIETITHNHGIQECPAPPKIIVWDEDKGRFVVNWQASYSDYAAMLYPLFKTQQAIDDFHRPIATKWNRVVRRLHDVQCGKLTKSGKPVRITDDNKIACEEMEKAGWLPHFLADSFSETEEETEETD